MSILMAGNLTLCIQFMIVNRHSVQIYTRSLSVIGLFAAAVAVNKNIGPEIILYFKLNCKHFCNLLSSSHGKYYQK